MLKLIHLILFLSIGTCFCSSQDDLPEVATPFGKVRGHWKTTIDGRKHAAFEGIPFAKPPVGDLRFEEPQPISAWPGIWEANNLHTCLQAELITKNPIKKIYGQEDCLYLNVYVPAEYWNAPKNLDVVVSIHGGGFMIGSGQIGADSGTVMDRDIVFVSFNYRVGILGFLSTEDDVIPGNNGMKDQVLALKWVKDNIALFGGNPDSITIVGLSAGGASVHLHYFSPLSEGLFVRGLSQSGTALAPWVVRKNALQRAQRLAGLMGCPESPSIDLKACLKQRPAENILQQLSYFFDSRTSLPLSPFSPVVEKNSRNAFLSKEPFQLLKEGNVLDVPWITSNTAEDGLLPAGFFISNLDEVNQHWPHVSKFILDYNDTLPLSKEEAVPKQILEYYLGQNEKIDKENFGKFVKMCTDRLFGIPAETAAKLQAKANRSPVYFYLFNYREGERSFAQYYTQSKEVKGVAHGDDLLYFYSSQPPLSQQDARMRNACQDMLFSYASSGTPSFDGSDTWQPTTAYELIFLNVTGPDSFDLQRVETLTSGDFWSKLGLLENENLLLKDEL